MNFNNEADYKAYFEAIATSHNDIEAFIFGDDDVIICGQRSEVSSGVTLWLDYYRPISVAGSSDNFIGNIIADFTVMKPIIPRDDTTADQQAEYKSCEDIVQQIFAKIHYDFQTDTLENEPQWNTGQFGRMEDTNFAGTIYRGAAAELGFHRSLDMEYDNTKWT